MILLEPNHPVIEKLIIEWITGERKITTQKIFDFDNVVYHFDVEGDDDNAPMTIGVELACYPQLAKAGAEAFLKSVYGDMIIPAKAPSHFALLLDKTKLSVSKEQVAKDIAMLKRNLMAAPLNFAIDALLTGAPADKSIGTIPFRDADAMFIQRTEDRVVVSFQIFFTEADDRSLSHVFLQEFADANKQLRTAPPCVYKEEVRPEGLSGAQGLKEGNGVSFIQFIFEKRHVQGERKEKALSLLTSFRSYLHYHLKCTKAYMHTRMRARTEGLLQVLRRAQPERVGGESGRKAFASTGGATTSK